MLARAVSRCGDVQAGRQCETLPSPYPRHQEDAKWTSAN